MKERKYTEIIGVLSTSLVLTSAMSISSCLPELLKTFDTYSRSSLELLVSIPAFSMMLIIACSPFLSAFINGRCMVIAGLCIYSIAGCIPAFTTSYHIFLVSRILMGIGIGFINTRAVSMIGERFHGNLQLRLQGIRCSMETLGQAALTMIAGQLLHYNWHYSFLIYAVGFLILVMYLKFVPVRKTKMKENTLSKTNYKLQRTDWWVIFQCCFLGGMHVSASVAISLRLTSYITENHLGTDIQGATILSIATFLGFLGGIVFGSLAKTFKNYMLPFSMCMTALGFLLIIRSANLPLISVGASMSSFAITNGISYLFNRLSSRLPKEGLNTGNAIVLVGCNTGSFTAPFVLRIFQVVNPELYFGFLSYAIIFLATALLIIFRNIAVNNKLTKKTPA